MSRDAAWEPPAGSAEASAPRPFGASPSDPASLRTWHSFYSMVVLSGASPQCVQYVRTSDGQMLDIGQNLCTNTAAGTWSQNGPTSRAARERLQWTGSGFVLIQADGSRLLYNARYNAASGSFYFLTDIYSKDGSPAARLSYAQPAVDGCPAGTDGSTPGAPYLSTAADAAGAALSFHYKALQRATGETECVIASVTAKDKASGAETALATYSYAVDSGGTERPGLVAQVVMPDQTLAYGYSDTDFVKSVGGTAEVHHQYDSSAHAIASFGENENLTFTPPPLPAGTCLSDSQCCSNAVVSRLTDLNALSGDGTGTSVESFSETTMVSQAPDVLSFREDRTEGTAPGKRYQYQCGSDQMPAHEVAEQDERGNWTAYTVAAPSSPQAPSSALETTAIARGASDASGTGALQSEQRTYVYGKNGEQLLATSTMASVLGDAGQAAKTRVRLRREQSTDERHPAGLDAGARPRQRRLDEGAAIPGDLLLRQAVRRRRSGRARAHCGDARAMLGEGFLRHRLRGRPGRRRDRNPRHSARLLADHREDQCGRQASLDDAGRARGRDGLRTASLQRFFDEYDALGNATKLRDANGVTTAMDLFREQGGFGDDRRADDADDARKWPARCNSASGRQLRRLLLSPGHVGGRVHRRHLVEESAMARQGRVRRRLAMVREGHLRLLARRHHEAGELLDLGRVEGRAAASGGPLGGIRSGGRPGSPGEPGAAASPG